ncbi:MAG: aminotransferase class I/II-fold pyridoxal phosphate-dependent enzyme [Planctomycetaceae bacterium]
MQISDDYSPLELTAEQLRRDVELTLDYLGHHLTTLDQQPAWDLADSSNSDISPRETIPVSGQPLKEVLDELFKERMNPSYNPSCGGYLAYVPGGGLPHAAIADLISGIVNKFITVWQVSPGFANMEADVVQWFAGLVGYSEESGGYLTTGGSLANWSAIVTARRVLLPDNFLNGVIYTTAQAHHSVTKSAILAGFPEANIRVVDTEELSLSTNHLQQLISNDLSEGMRPFMVVANAGTTNTGAIDPLIHISKICKQHEMWMHTDAAYGGFFMMTERGREALRGLELSDSITLDPHKALFLPYGTGCLLVKDITHLQKAHKVSAKYLPPFQENPEHVDFCGISPELSRDFRGLRIWLPFKLFGAPTFASYLDEKLDLCQHAYQQISELRNIEILAAPKLSTFAFRYNPAHKDLDEAELNELNQRFLKELNASKRFLLSSTYLNDAFTIRVCILCFRTHAKHVRFCVDEVSRVVNQFNNA